MSKTDQDTVARVEAFHGHMCPGLAMGIRASELALERIGSHSADEEVVAIVETDMCGVDAIQYMTGCTFGKGNLLHRDYGKNAYTFARRSDGAAIRVVSQPQAYGPDDDDWRALFATVRSGSATTEQRARFQVLHRARAERILDAPVEDLYQVVEVDVKVPPRARIHTSVACADCGENTMETRIRILDSRSLCPPCFDAAIAGRSPVVLHQPQRV
ncbi:MAG: FmdE family protein [Acidimicrobiales bacterium]